MSKQLIDIVNFNADASCYSSARWIEDLEGGETSSLYKWINIYVKNNKKISLGFVGATIADIKYYNPEVIELINDNEDIFEIILRPWSHDISIYRDDETFLFNVNLGINIIEKEFKNISRYFLSPEFMTNSKQIELLSQLNIKGIFINPNRYDTQTASRISSLPYQVLGTSNKLMNCISIYGNSAKSYLKTIQLFNESIWNNTILSYENERLYSWRDGESSFLIPDGLEREKYWLENEDNQIVRVFLNELDIIYVKNKDLELYQYKSYPIHSFLAWMQEMKMMWYIEKVKSVESNFKNLTTQEKIIFLQLINSDILASVEKKSPTIDIMIDEKLEKYTIYRQEKGLEGEQYLSMINDKESEVKYKNDNFYKKFKSRDEYIHEL